MRSRFVVDLPGQPPSWNSTYRIVHLRAKSKTGQALFRPDGSPKTYSTMKKTAAVTEYQRIAAEAINKARPSEFQPGGLIYVLYELYLKRDVDCDNVMKAIDDTLSHSLGINDRMFLPVAISKEKVKENPHVHLTILDAEHWQIGVLPR